MEQLAEAWVRHNGMNLKVRGLVMEWARGPVLLQWTCFEDGTVHRTWVQASSVTWLPARPADAYPVFGYGVKG